MNYLLDNNISVKGLDQALKIARDLIEADYQVMVQLDDGDIYIVSYEYNDLTYGSNRFASITPEEEEDIYDARLAAKLNKDKDIAGDDEDDYDK
ncbi:hypothetical protein [Zhenhengia sp.]|uniref:hypothetical protein n=1 Tax=Zhenhengia sp. TaxID=2944208 RepID=UPI0030795579